MLHYLKFSEFYFDSLKYLWIIDKENKKYTDISWLLYTSDGKVIKQLSGDIFQETEYLYEVSKNKPWEMLPQIFETYFGISQNMQSGTHSTNKMGHIVFSSSFSKLKRKEGFIGRGMEYIFPHTMQVNTSLFQKKIGYSLIKLWAYGQLNKKLDIPMPDTHFSFNKDFIEQTNVKVGRYGAKTIFFKTKDFKEIHQTDTYEYYSNHAIAGKNIGDYMLWHKTIWKKRKTLPPTLLKKDKKGNYEFVKTLEFPKGVEKHFFDCVNVVHQVVLYSQSAINNFHNETGWTHINEASIITDYDGNIILDKTKEGQWIIPISFQFIYSNGDYLKIFASPKAIKKNLKLKEHPDEFAFIVTDGNTYKGKFIDFTGWSPYWLKHFENKPLGYKLCISFKKNNIDAFWQNEEGKVIEDDYVVFSITRLTSSVSRVEYYTFDNLTTPFASELLFANEDQVSHWIMAGKDIFENKDWNIFTATYDNSLFYLMQTLKNIVVKWGWKNFSFVKCKRFFNDEYWEFIEWMLKLLDEFNIKDFLNYDLLKKITFTPFGFWYNITKDKLVNHKNQPLHIIWATKIEFNKGIMPCFVIKDESNIIWNHLSLNIKNKQTGKYLCFALYDFNNESFKLLYEEKKE